MRILAIEKEVPGIPAEACHPHLKDEARCVWQLYLAGVVREMYFRQDQTTAVLMLECATADEAHATLSTLPLVRAGLITFEVIPLVPYPGLARLFAP